MSTNELREKSRENLNKELLESRAELFKLRMQKGSGQAAPGHKVKNARRQIARVKTIMNELSKKSEGGK